jgi:Tol biopolymer transport system component
LLNAAFATDGRSLAFISTRDGNHELYATTIDGAMPRRLTEEFAMDDHPAWSPDRTQVVFSSTRQPSDRPGLAWNALYVLRNPHFAPDGRWIVFTSRRAGFSAEEISLPHQPQPYGDLFAVRLDGTGLVRLTHNGFEEGTPAWGPRLASDIVPAAANHSATGDDY